MNSKHYCITCTTDYGTADKLRSHRTYMRSKGETEGHEIKMGELIAGSTKGSQIGTKDTQLKDVDMFDLPNSCFTKQEEHLEEPYGFTKDESLKTLAV